MYPNGRRALADVDLIVPDGDFVFLVGPSGAGKSTLIKLLIRDELPTSGTVFVAGRDVRRMPRREVPRLRRTIGIVFQDFKLLPRKSVRDNVAFALEVTGTPGPPDRARGRARPRPGGADRAGGPAPATSCRAASSSARPSRGRWSTSRVSSSPTSRRGTWTR